MKLQKRLVLIGGGHSHALLARMHAMDPVPGLEVVLISDVCHTPYSGMLPGFLAGTYSYDEIHIDLRQLCQFAGVEYIQGRVTGVNPKQRSIQILNRPDVSYDLLSINTGSTPNVEKIAGADRFATGAKLIQT